MIECQRIKTSTDFGALTQSELFLAFYLLPTNFNCHHYHNFSYKRCQLNIIFCLKFEPLERENLFQSSFIAINFRGVFSSVHISSNAIQCRRAKNPGRRRPMLLPRVVLDARHSSNQQAGVTNVLVATSFTANVALRGNRKRRMDSFAAPTTSVRGLHAAWTARLGRHSRSV